MWERKKQYKNPDNHFKRQFLLKCFHLDKLSSKCGFMLGCDEVKRAYDYAKSYYHKLDLLDFSQGKKKRT
jgi:hypothetical protein